jgi:PiT family inorganic phosphate transporter
MITTLLVVVIIMAIGFDYINGFHDAANSIATIVSTKVLSPFQAVVWAAIFNLVAYFVFTEHKVANTIAATVFEQFITLHVILAGLIAAVSWNLFTWWFGIPSSSSHTLIGGFAGAGMAKAVTVGSSALAAVNPDWDARIRSHFDYHSSHFQEYEAFYSGQVVQKATAHLFRRIKFYTRWK